MPYRKVYFAGALTALLLLGFIATSMIRYFVAHDSLSTRIADETLPLTSDNIYSEIEQDLLRSILISSLMAHDTFVRDVDTICRWGGDEFLVLLQECRGTDARAKAEQIRKAVSERPIQYGRERIVLTVTIGVTEHRTDEDLATALERADATLYEAKRAGRDRVARS